MTAMPLTERMTAEEYPARPEDPRKRGWELISGALIDMADPSLPHELARTEIFHALAAWSRAAAGRGLAIGSIDVLVGPRDVYGPDILRYRAERVPPRDPQRPHAVADLAVEVRSPSTWRYDIGAKKSGYERAGLPELWLVDIAGDVVLVFRRSRPGGPEFDIALELTRGDTMTSPLLPGFSLQLGPVFGT